MFESLARVGVQKWSGRQSESPVDGAEACRPRESFLQSGYSHASTPHNSGWQQRVRSTSVIFCRRSNWLCTVVTRDADRFPELGMQYQKDLVAGRTEILMKYLGRTARTNKWILTSAQRAGVVYEALLRADLFETVLHGIHSLESRVIPKQARSAANVMWRLLEAGTLGAD
jgi:hypothetical protein